MRRTVHFLFTKNIAIPFLAPNLVQTDTNSDNTGARTMRFVSPKTIVYLVAFYHLVLAAYGVYSSIEDIRISEEPFVETEGLIIGGFFSLHVFLIWGLCYGVQQHRPNWMLPWIVMAFLAFGLGTWVTGQNWFDNNIIGFAATMTNILHLAVMWGLWYVVLWYYRYLKANLEQIQGQKVFEKRKIRYGLAYHRLKEQARLKKDKSLEEASAEPKLRISEDIL